MTDYRVLAGTIELQWREPGDAVWRSVTVPMVAPKPDLTALTGGYRKVPVMQIGADVYCDTRLIAEVIDEQLPGGMIVDQDEVPGTGRAVEQAVALAVPHVNAFGPLDHAGPTGGQIAVVGEGVHEVRTVQRLNVAGAQRGGGGVVHENLCEKRFWRFLVLVCQLYKI